MSIDHGAAAKFRTHLARLRVALVVLGAIGALGIPVVYFSLGANAAALVFLAWSMVTMPFGLAYHYSPCPACGNQYFIKGRPGTLSWAVNARSAVSLFRTTCRNCGFSIVNEQDAKESSN